MLVRYKRIHALAIVLLTLGVGEQIVRAAQNGVPASWQGQSVGRMSIRDQGELESALRLFFGRSTGSIVPRVGPFLFDQFNAVGMPDQFRLPDGRVIVNASDGRAGINAVTVIADIDTPSVLATAFLTNLCPQSGVDENFAASDGVKHKEHFRCELDYSLIIMYASGRTPDPDINLELTRWAKAYVEAMQLWVVPADRKLMLKRFVRVLQDRPIDLSAADEALPLTVSVVPSLSGIRPTRSPL